MAVADALPANLTAGGTRQPTSVFSRPSKDWSLHNGDQVGSVFSLAELDNRSENAGLMAWDQFDLLISARTEYLDGLRLLPSGWISGGGVRPDEFSIQAAKEFLTTIRRRLLLEGRSRTPNLVMGPIPSGGITIELHDSPQDGMYLNLYNGGAVDFEVKKNDHFIDIEVSREFVIGKAVDTYFTSARF
jgi:hypothetical protein